MKKTLIPFCLLLMVAALPAATPRENLQELRAAYEAALWVTQATTTALVEARTSEDAVRALQAYQLDIQPVRESFERLGKTFAPFARPTPVQGNEDRLGADSRDQLNAFREALLSAVARFGNDPDFQEALLAYRVLPAEDNTSASENTGEKPAR